MIPTKERKRVARPENKRSRPKITKNKSCIRKTKKGFKIRIVSKMKKEIGKLVLVQERISEKRVLRSRHRKEIRKRAKNTKKNQQSEN